MSAPLAVLGADVLGALVHEAASLAGLEVAGFVDDRASASPPAGLELLGGVGELPRLRERGVEAVFVAVGDNERRRELSTAVAAAGLPLATVVHPRAFVSPTASLGEGVFVDALASVHANARVGRGTVLMPHAWLAHDVVAGEFCWLSGHSAVGGFARLGDGCRLGVGSRVDAYASVEPHAALPPGRHVGRDG